MEIFPAQYSTLSSTALQKYIANSYELPVTQCKYLLRGVSDTYVIYAGNDKFIFKVYRSCHRSFNEIESEIELLDSLKEGGVKVAFAIADKNGGYIQRFNAAEGERYGVLFIFAPGKVSLVPNELELNAIAREMAKIHNITAGMELKYPRIVYDIDTILLNPLKILDPAFIDFPEGLAYLRETAKLVIVKMKQIDTSKFSYGYCHYDLLPKNFHFDDDGSITFFDFDWAGKGYLANDIMTFFFQYYWLTYYKKITAEDAQKAFETFVAAYRQIRLLADEELAAIPYLWFSFMVFGTAFQYEHFDDFSNYYFNTRYLKERIEMIKQLVEWHCIF
jgi:Ser/Thr protein kinase RdoA (MazF antagonist)